MRKYAIFTSDGDDWHDRGTFHTFDFFESQEKADDSAWEYVDCNCNDDCYCDEDDDDYDGVCYCESECGCGAWGVKVADEIMHYSWQKEEYQTEQEYQAELTDDMKQEIERSQRLISRLENEKAQTVIAIEQETKNRLRAEDKLLIRMYSDYSKKE